MDTLPAPMSKRIIVTSALPYANGPLHFGHAIGAYLPADIYVRTQRARGRDVVYICGTDEHGVAITLTAASDVLFVEQDWTPENNYQAACRAHRIGQKDGVLAQAMYLNNSVDERVQRALVRKQNDLTKLYEKEPDHA